MSFEQPKFKRVQEERKQRKEWLFALFKPVACAYTDVKIERELVNTKQIKGWEKEQSMEVMVVKASHRKGSGVGALEQRRDTPRHPHTSPSVPESPQGSCTNPSDAQVSGFSPTARVPPRACPQQLSPYHWSRHVPRLSFLGQGRAVTLLPLTPRVCQIAAIKGRKVQL